jgi:ferredoxin-NADP reductase
MFSQINLTTSLLRSKPTLGRSSRVHYVYQVAQELSDVRTYQIGVEPGTFRFVPGQYVVLGLPEMNLEGAMAISSSPYDTDTFCVTVKRTGAFGTAFYDTILDGSPVFVGPPSGMSCIADEGRRPVCFIGRDHAITSARSMARFISMETDRRQFTLLHELSGHSQILFENEFQHPNYEWMKRSLYLDSENQPAHWTQQMGPIIPFVVINEVPNFMDTEFFVAGDGKDVRRVRGVLRELNIPLQQIHTERWTF